MDYMYNRRVIEGKFASTTPKTFPQVLMRTDHSLNKLSVRGNFIPARPENIEFDIIGFCANCARGCAWQGH